VEARKVLDTNLLIDGETGLTTILNVIEYPKSLDDETNEVIWPTRADYLTAVEIMVLLQESGKPVPAIDVLLSAICLNRKLTLATKEKHFNYVKEVKEELSLEIRTTTMVSGRGSGRTT
jgi:tRNA(fMet)-specific endonuclease VapC